MKPSKMVVDGKEGLVCPFCKYGAEDRMWIPRVSDPVSCPKCKVRFDYPVK